MAVKSDSTNATYYYCLLFGLDFLTVFTPICREIDFTKKPKKTVVTSNIPYPFVYNHGVLFFKMGFWVRFNLNKTEKLFQSMITSEISL